MAAAKVNRPRRQNDPRRGTGERHDARPNSAAIDTMRSAELSPGRLITTPFAEIVTDRPAAASSTITGTKAGAAPPDASAQPDDIIPF